jgi:hypothetical protein
MMAAFVEKLEDYDPREPEAICMAIDFVSRVLKPDLERAGMRIEGAADEPDDDQDEPFP